MSSPSSSGFNSPPASGTRHQKSRYTYRHLGQLALFTPNCPLRVIAHVDLDAFYAQCEMVRLNVPENQPLAVQQWQGLIAINYPARKFGLNRHITITEAKKLCPDLITQHVATWKEGEESWAYHDEAFKNMATHKVSLDPYRLESRRIVACIKESLPEEFQRIERASIDEVFLDLSALVHIKLLEQYPKLREPPPYDDPTEFLPHPPRNILDWAADALVDLDSKETEEDYPDWDDIAVVIGSEIVRNIRANILEKLRYTCSAGIAQNKMLAKLGSAHKKPNQQTIIRRRAVESFLSNFNFTQIRGLGGKLGEKIIQEFATEKLDHLLSISHHKLKQALGDETGTWVYQIIRGQDYSEVSSRTQIKSMLSAKSFRPSITTHEQAYSWLRIFAADLYSRLVEEGVLENRRRPKTIHLHHKNGAQTKSRSGLIPLGRKIKENDIFELARSLLDQMNQDGQAWPCANLSLSVGGFENGVTGNMGIGNFLIKSNDIKAMHMDGPNAPDDSIERLDKRRRLDNTTGIHRYFHKNAYFQNLDNGLGAQRLSVDKLEHRGSSLSLAALSHFQTREDGIEAMTVEPRHQGESDFLCTRCHMNLECADTLQNHLDWHLARDLQDKESQKISLINHPVKNSWERVSSTHMPNSGKGKSKKVQSRLQFGGQDTNGSV
ncbi:BgTH12-02139 [Blumeria graminis f. sp. triticale]|uniref:DNA polymerase eta n=1 Tax=Blumeria graminis f. sp. triticale TaxID=1689686 RepID=A0A9W4GDT9_BLUGR|nr:BgTH12-02139 [Blumeria graminis f. sp. triticale]